MPTRGRSVLDLRRLVVEARRKVPSLNSFFALWLSSATNPAGFWRVRRGRRAVVKILQLGPEGAFLRIKKSISDSSRTTDATIDG
jgi:hypothetical protein